MALERASAMPVFEIVFSLSSIGSSRSKNVERNKRRTRGCDNPALRSCEVPQQIPCQHAPRHGSAVTKSEDYLVQVFHLESVVERVAETMCPVEQGKRAQHEEINSCQGQTDQR